MYRKNDLRGSRCVIVEGLERRELLSSNPWAPAAKLIGQDLAVAHYPKLTGAGEAVAVIDSGVDYKHPSLGSGLGMGHKVVAGWDFISNDADPMSDTFAHGTGTAGVIAANSYVYKGLQNQGIAPGVKIIALREDGTAGVKAALEWVLNNREKYNIVAVNMVDFGGGTGSTYADVLKRLIADGVFVSHPSGNGGASAPVRDALDPGDFAVGSVSFADKVSSFTQRGAALDLLAPGEHVTIPWYDVAKKTSIYENMADGTSWASPAVVGTAALIKQIDPSFTPAQMMQIMQDSGTPIYDSVSGLTYKRLNLDAALTLAYQRKGQASTPVPPLPSPPVPVPDPAPIPAPTPTPTPVAQAPFSGTPTTIVGETTLQVEDFDIGGEGVAYHETDAKNQGNSSYRSGIAVDLMKVTGGGAFVGYTRAGEWLEYTVNVPTAGTFHFTARIASLKVGGKFHIEVDGVDKTGAITVPNTGNWGSWSVIGKAGVSLTAGTHVVRLKMDSKGQSGYVADFDWIRFSPAATQTPTPTPTPAKGTRSAFKPLFGLGADECLGVAPLSNYVGYLDEGDWLGYTKVDFGNGATKFTASVAVPKDHAGKKIQVRLGSLTGTVVATLTVASTGSWTNFIQESAAMSKVTGVQDIYLTFVGGYGVANLDWFKFS
ncbi:MAG: hypothetical protein JWN40_1558 [Phycisphaerales bacterium]|nr:hypothetical protein [Phycisphaerales bacterium]